jgi:hypothetical protein
MSIISNKLKLALFLLLASSLGFAQGAIYINTTFTATGQSTSASSINGAVDTFMLQYYTTGVPATLSIQIEGDNGSGSFVLCGAAVTTVTSGQTKCVGNFKQVRVNLTTLTGGTAPTVVATLVGNSSADEPTGSAAAQVQGAGTTGAAVVGGPVLVGYQDGSGNLRPIGGNTTGTIGTIISAAGTDGLVLANLGCTVAGGNGATLCQAVMPQVLGFGTNTYNRQFACDKTARLNALAATTTQIVAAVAAQKIRICSAVLDNNSATATNVKFVEGTGANCATGQTDVTALLVLGANTLASDDMVIPLGSSGAWVTTTAADALCATGSAAGSAEITITYTQF